MKLVLELLGPPRLMGARRRCELHTGSLSIGRSPEAGWVIPDTERMISRLHLRVDSSHGAFLLTDTSTNGVYVNGGAAPVGFGASVALRDGDRLQVGDAQITVSVVNDEGAPAGVVPPGPGADPLPPAPAAIPRARDPLGGPFGAAAGPAGPPSGQAAEPVPPLRGGVDANWMIKPLGTPPAQVPPQAGRTPPGPRGVLDLLDGRPDVAARDLAAAVDQAAGALDPAARSALLAGIAAALARR